MLASLLAGAGIVLAGLAEPGLDAKARLRGLEWYHDYTFDLSTEVGHKVAVVRCGPQNSSDPEAVARMAARFPGHFWIICNEPDQPGQDGGRGDYEAIMRTYVQTIKGADPSAVTIGPNVLSTSSDFRYPDIFDIYGVHYYETRGVPLDITRRTWVTEFGSEDRDPRAWIRDTTAMFRWRGVEKYFLFASDPIPSEWVGGKEITTIGY